MKLQIEDKSIRFNHQNGFVILSFIIFFYAKMTINWVGKLFVLKISINNNYKY